MPGERRTETGGALPGEAARSLFSKFRALLEANTAALGTMAVMERMLGGEYIFDRTFLENAAREVADCAHQAVYAVNAMTGNRHVALYDRFMAIAAAVEDILAGRPEADDERLARPIGRLRLEDRPFVGEAAALLGELSSQLGLAVPRGFALTREAFPDGLSEDGRAAAAAALADPEDGPGTATVCVRLERRTASGLPAYRELRGVPARPEPVLTALTELAGQLQAEAATPEPANLAAVVAAMPPAVRRGRLWTHWRDADGPAVLRLDIWPETAPTDAASCRLGRSHPFARLDAAPGQSFLLSPEASAELAGRAMTAERLFGAPLEMAFAIPGNGQVVFESVRLAAPPATAAPPVADAATVLLSGGEAACLGMASGAVVHVDDTTPAADFPFGAIAVARSASPVLAPLLRRAGGLVAEVGDATGHLAAVAREYRTPALFGARGARTALPEGALVTMDAGAGTVRRGTSEILPAPEEGLSPDDPEYLTLRRLLRRIATLNLTDPKAPDFSADGCHTLHDILHYAHVQAVNALADLRLAGVSERPARLLPLPVPLDLRVLDIGGGLAPRGTGFETVRSVPLRAFLAGVLEPGLWDTTPAPLRLGNILGALDKPLPVAGDNLAIIARTYCNISLRLGYHFTIIDAHLGENPEKNTIYFRFVGGLGDPAGRAARAVFMQRILARYDFKATVTGDLLVARIKRMDPKTGAEALRLLGRLCAFSRQRDTGRPDVDALEAAFFELVRANETGSGERP